MVTPLKLEEKLFYFEKFNLKSNLDYWDEAHFLRTQDISKAIER